MKATQSRPLQLMVIAGEENDPNRIRLEFARHGFDCEVSSDRTEALRRAGNDSADLFLLQGPQDQADMLLLADQLQSRYPNLAGRILFLPDDPASTLDEMVGRLAPVMKFLARASGRIGSPPSGTPAGSTS